MGKQHPFYRVKLWGRNQKWIQKTEKIPLPLPILDRHKNLHLYMDIFMKMVWYYYTLRKENQFPPDKTADKRGATSFIKALDEIKTKCDTRGFNITDYHGDNEFNIKTLEKSLLSILLHIYAKMNMLG